MSGRTGVPAPAAVAAAAARVLEPELLPARLRFSTDTRALERGDAFVALRGERFDGHAFVRDALALGAAALVVADASVVPAGVPALVVADTTRAYLAFGGVARAGSRTLVAGITGSTGKTTTKALLAQLLESTGARVAATPANENNEIGVAKLLLGLPADAAFAVVEFGARHYRDIAPLAAAARPDVALLTNVGEAHLEIMGSRERLAQTKWDVFSAGGRPVLNVDDEVTRERAPALQCAVTWFGTRRAPHALPAPGAYVAIAGAAGDDPAGVGDELLVVDEANGRSATYPIRVTLAGAHNRANLAAAAAAALALGVAPERIAGAIPALVLPPGRYERCALGGVDVIYDAYNASLSGTLATLASFAREPAARRIAVLGSMAELGSGASDMHVRAGEAAARAGVAALLAGGEYARDLARGAARGGLPAERIVPFEGNDDALRWLRANLRDGDLVLLKASRRYKLEEILDGLRATHA